MLQQLHGSQAIRDGRKYRLPNEPNHFETQPFVVHYWPKSMTGCGGGTVGWRMWFRMNKEIMTFFRNVIVHGFHSSIKWLKSKGWHHYHLSFISILYPQATGTDYHRFIHSLIKILYLLPYIFVLLYFVASKDLILRIQDQPQWNIICEMWYENHKRHEIFISTPV